MRPTRARAVPVFPVTKAVLGAWVAFVMGAVQSIAAADSAPMPAASSAENIISNGDFEQASKAGDWPDGWGSQNPANGKTWELENGKHFVRLVSQHPGQVQMLYREIKLKPGEVGALQVAARYRDSGVKTGEKTGDDARLLFLFRDLMGNLLETGDKPLVFSPQAKDWTEANEQVTVPLTAVRLYVIAGLARAQAGTIDLASITGIPVKGNVTSAETKEVSALALLPNSNFEKANAEGTWPEGWGRPVAGITWEKEDNFRFMRFVQSSPGKTLMLYRTVKVSSGVHGLNVAIRFRSTGVEHGMHEWFDARTIMHFLDKDGQSLPLEHGSIDFVFTHKPAPTPWIERTQFTPVPEGAAQLELRPGFFQANAGTLDIAEIRVTALSDEKTDLLQMADAAYGSWKGDQNDERERQIDGELATKAVTGNLVPNGSFEAATVNPSWPDEWGKTPPAGASLQHEEGKSFVRLISQDPQKVAMLYKMIILPRGLKGVEISLRYRTSGIIKGDALPGDARAVLHFLDGTRFGHLENGRELEPSPSTMVFSPQTATWTEVKQRCLVPEGATKLQFMPGLWNVKQGTLDLADIRVMPLDDAAVAEMQSGKAKP